MTATKLALSIQEAAAALSISMRHLKTLLKNGTIKSVKLGERRVIPVEEITRILRE